MRIEPTERFSVVTYNVLAQAYVRRDRYESSPEDALAPDARQRLLLARIAELNADIYCLQEVEPEVHEAVARRLGAAYTGAYEQKRGRPDGCSVFARRERFAVTSTRALRYRARDRGDEQLALIAECVERRAERPLTIASTHLRWQKRETPPSRHVGRLQMIELLDHLQQRVPTDQTWLLAGDLNALSDSVVLRAALDRGAQLSCRAQRPWDTVNINGRRRKLDYLLFPRDHLHPTPGALPRLRRDTPMPSTREPSDHLPLRVEYSWRAR